MLKPVFIAHALEVAVAAVMVASSYLPLSSRFPAIL